MQQEYDIACFIEIINTFIAKGMLKASECETRSRKLSTVLRHRVATMCSCVMSWGKNTSATINRRCSVDWL
jgi:hypothetical protein